MQTTVNYTQPAGLKGQINPDVPNLFIPRYTEDENCEAGKFVFEGTDAESQVLGLKEGATLDKIVGIAQRVPFQSYNGSYGDKYIQGKDVTILIKGNIFVTPSNAAAYKDYVFVNPTTGEIQTGTDDSKEGFLKTSWRVTRTKQCGDTVEISNIQFN